MILGVEETEETHEEDHISHFGCAQAANLKHRRSPKRGRRDRTENYNLNSIVSTLRNTNGEHKNTEAGDTGKLRRRTRV